MTRFVPFFVRLILLASLSLIAFSCGEDTVSPTAPRSDSVTLQSLSPLTSVPLRRGEPASFEVTVRYSVGSAPSARLVLVVQDQKNHGLSRTEPQPETTVERGEGYATLRDRIAVPTSAGVTAVKVFVALVPAGSNTSTSSISVPYPVRQIRSR
jgi:hypothetical protein